MRLMKVVWFRPVPMFCSTNECKNNEKISYRLPTHKHTPELKKKIT